MSMILSKLPVSDAAWWWIAFVALNLCLLIFCRPLSILILKFFALGRRICPPEKWEQETSKVGFSISYNEHFNPSRKQATQLLAWTGGVHLLGLLGLGLMIWFGVFDDSKTGQQHEASSLPLHQE